MSNLEQGLENNVILLEKELDRKKVSKQHLLKIYGNLKVLEYRAITENEKKLIYKIQDILLDIEEVIFE